MLRRLYLRRLMLGLGGSVAFTAALLLLPHLFPSVAKMTKPPIIQIALEVLQPPSIMKKDPPRPQDAPRRAQRTELPPLVVTHEVEDLPIINEAPSVDVPDDAVGTASAPVVEAPVAVIPPPAILTVAQVMPAYEGGQEGMMKYLSRKLRYPPSAQRVGAEGTVFVSFVVNGDGSVSDVTLLRGFHPDCDKEALRVIQSMRGWTGGKQGGIPVRVRMSLPIKFRIN